MPRCKHCKEKFEAIHFNQKYCTKKECMKDLSQKAQKKAKSKMSAYVGGMAMKKKKKT